MRAGHRPHIGDMHPMQRHAPAPLLVFPTLSNTRRCSCQVAAAKSGRLCSGTHSILPSSSTKISSPPPSSPGRKPYTGPSATSHTTRFFGDFPPLFSSSSSSAMVFTQPRTGQQILPVSPAVIIVPFSPCLTSPMFAFYKTQEQYYARSTNATANNKRALQQLPPLVCRRAPDEVISWPSSTAPRRYLPQTRGPPPPAPSNWRQALAADSV